MPITTIKGGISAFRILILKPNNSMVAKLQITPSMTTDNDSHIALKLRKNQSKITADKKKEARTNILISLTLRPDNSVRICGSPLL